MSKQNWQLAAQKRALEIVESEGIMNEFGCINVDRSHTGGRPCFGYAGKKTTIAQAIAMPAKGLHTRHLCNDEACINPDHLVVGTPSENTLDAYEFGALQRGEGHPKAVQLTDEEISAIRADRRSQAAIGREWGIAQSTVGQIKRREGRWASDASSVHASTRAAVCSVGNTFDITEITGSQGGDATLAEGSDPRQTTGAGG